MRARRSISARRTASSAGTCCRARRRTRPRSARSRARRTRSQQAAAKAGMRASDLRGNVSTKSISTGAGASTLRVTANPLVRLIVQAPTTAKGAGGGEHARADRRPAACRRSRTRRSPACRNASTRTSSRSTRSSGRSAARPIRPSKAVFALHLGDVLDDQLQAKQLLIQAQEVERPKVLTRAAAVKTTARSRRNAVVVAGFLGLLIGLLAALLWEPVVRRRAR